MSGTAWRTAPHTLRLARSSAGGCAPPPDVEPRPWRGDRIACARGESEHRDRNSSSGGARAPDRSASGDGCEASPVPLADPHRGSPARRHKLNRGVPGLGLADTTGNSWAIWLAAGARPPPRACRAEGPRSVTNGIETTTPYRVCCGIVPGGAWAPRSAGDSLNTMPRTVAGPVGTVPIRPRRWRPTRRGTPNGPSGPGARSAPRLALWIPASAEQHSAPSSRSRVIIVTR